MVGGGGPLDRKIINDVLDKHLEKTSSPSTSRFLYKEKERIHMPSTSAAGGGGKSHQQEFDTDKRLEKTSSPYDLLDHISTSTIAPTKINSSDVESETESEESDVSGSDGDDTSWISWFCNLRGNNFFCEVDYDYIEDDFNLCGLSSQVPNFDYALDLILDVESSHDEFTEERNEQVESAAEMLYGLIHARYILTSKGMYAMLEKYKDFVFGSCPRVYCCGQPCLPVGQSDIPGSSIVKIYCPKCDDIYYPSSKYQGNIDGAYFGTTFPHLCLLNYTFLKKPKATESFVPKVFGFKLHKP